MGLLQVSMLVGSALSGFILERLYKENVKAMCMVAFPIMALVVLSLRFPAVAGNPMFLPVLLVFYGFFQGWIMPASPSPRCTSRPTSWARWWASGWG